MAVVCWPVKEAMSSLSSSGTVVSVLVSPSSCPPPRRDVRAQWLAALPMSSARSHCSRAGAFGRTARVIAVLRRWRAI